MPKWSLPNTRFLPKAHPAFLGLGSLQHFGPDTWGPFLIVKSTKDTKMRGKIGSSWTMKTTLLTLWEMEQEDRALLHVPPAGSERRGQLQVWPLRAGLQMDTKASQVLIWGLRMDSAQQVGKFTDTGSRKQWGRTLLGTGSFWRSLSVLRGVGCAVRHAGS